MTIWRSGKTSVRFTTPFCQLTCVLVDETCRREPVHAVYNLVEGEDVEATEARVAAYQRENFESIIQNDARKVWGHAAPV